MRYMEDITSWSVPLVLEPGDCVVFDPRVLHGGAPLNGPKNMISLSYGTENEHTIEAYFYGRIVRTEEGYTDWSDEVVDELRARNMRASLAAIPRSSTAYTAGICMRPNAPNWAGEHPAVCLASTKNRYVVRTMAQKFGTEFAGC